MKKIKVSKKMIAYLIAAVVVLSAAGMYVATQTNAKLVETQMIAKATVQKLIKETGTVESEASGIITAKSVMEIKGLDFKEGDTVNVGQVILKTDVTAAKLTVKSMQSEASGLRIQYNRARDTAAQSKLLVNQGAISQDDYLQVVTARDQLAAQVAAMEYSIASMKKNMDAGGITAPISGTITQVYAKVGETLQSGAQILEISDLSTLFMSVNLIAEDADQIKVGSKVLVYNKNSGYRDEKAFIRKIHLKAFDLVSDLGISQKRVKVEIELSSTANLRLGNNMDVEITVDKRENVLAVSKKAVFELNKKNAVYVVAQGKVVLREVDLGLKGEESWEVLSGLSEGERVIISPDNSISDGMRVKI